MFLLSTSLNRICSRLISNRRILIKETYQQTNRFIVFKGAMKYQKKIFFTSQDIATTQDAQGAELKSVANDSKYLF